MPPKSWLSRQLPIRKGLSESEAAIYLSLSPNFFRKLVKQGLMPRPRIAGGRRIWDIAEVERAFLDLPREGGGTDCSADDSWSDFE